MANKLYREKSIERISSPEQLNDYLRVTKPSVWIVLIAVIVLIVGMLIWASFTYIGTRTDAVAIVEDGKITATLGEEIPQKYLDDSMVIIINDKSFEVTAADISDGNATALMADTDLDDGKYDAKVEYKKTKIISLLFNN